MLFYFLRTFILKNIYYLFENGDGRDKEKERDVYV